VATGSKPTSIARVFRLQRPVWGQKVASELCTVIDDGTINSRRGSLNVDDEVTLHMRNVLIENGVLQGYLQTSFPARCCILRPPAAAAGELRAHPHAAHDEYLYAGRRERARRHHSLRAKGLYCANFGGGQVDITSGNFVFSASESYSLRTAQAHPPGAPMPRLSANGPEALKYVSMVGNDLKLDERDRGCGKEGQSVPVGVGIHHQDRPDDGRRDRLGSI